MARSDFGTSSFAGAAMGSVKLLGAVAVQQIDSFDPGGKNSDIAGLARASRHASGRSGCAGKVCSGISCTMTEEADNSDEMIIRFNLDAYITFMNKPARELMVEEGREGIGLHFSEFIGSDYCRAYLNALCQSADLFGNLGSTALRPVVMRRPGGRSFPANMRIRECSRPGQNCFVAYIKPASRLR